MIRHIGICIFLSSLFFYACTSQNKEQQEKAIEKRSIKRYGQVINVKPEKLEYYKELHANAWPCVLNKINECNIRNFSIYQQDEYLFAYFEYVGNDFSADMEKMAKDSCTVKWWRETDPCQEPISSAKPGEWWTTMEEVFHSK